MKIRYAVLLLLVAASPSVVLADEAEEIKKFVLDAQRAGIEGSDLAHYMSQWADDGRIVMGRSAKRGTYDLTLNRLQIENWGKLRLGDSWAPLKKLEHKNPKVEISGDEAALSVVTVVRVGQSMSETGETFLLRRTPDGWRVVENRCWLVRDEIDGEETVYSDEYWNALDNYIEQVRPTGNLRDLARSLFHATRIVESYATARELTQNERATAEDWCLRGYGARYLGNIEDAAKSWRKALELDPNARVPSYIRPPEPEAMKKRPFYVAENAKYTIVDSVVDSIRFTLDKTLTRDKKGHLASTSSFVNPEGEVMGWHDFGNLEGPGWAANAVGGALEIHAWAKFLDDPKRQEKAVSILDHVLEGGFIDEETGFIRGYRETTTDKMCLNYTHNSDWFCPGSMAKVAFQLLTFADQLDDDPRAKRMRTIATRCAKWIDENVEPVPNGWFPRRTTPEGKVYRKSPTGGDDPFWQTSADGLFIMQLQAALTKRGLADYRKSLRQKADVFVAAEGIFGSINHDTYDPNENVAYSVAFRTLMLTSVVLEDEPLRTFAYKRCLAPLDQFKMNENRNGVATRGLLYMEKTWDTSYLWENAEAALANFEAAVELRYKDPARSRECELDGLTILRAAAKHHHGPHGFLTEGVDWNNHVGQQHHIDQAEFAAIQYTEPFLNNQHIAEPTLYYLRHLAEKRTVDGKTEWRDVQRNELLSRP